METDCKSVGVCLRRFESCTCHHREPGPDLRVRRSGDPGCRFWKVGVADPVIHQPVSSRIPTLVLSGEFDGALPAYMVRQMLPTLKRSTYVEMPMSHHLQLASYNNSHECSRRLATAFLAQPKAPVDTSCIDDLPRFDYTPLGPAISSLASTGMPLTWRGAPSDRREPIRSKGW